MCDKDHISSLKDILSEAGLLTDESEEFFKRKKKKDGIQEDRSAIEKSLEKRKKSKKKVDDEEDFAHLDEMLEENPEKKKDVKKKEEKKQSEDPGFQFNEGEGLTKRTTLVMRFTDNRLQAFMSADPVKGDPIDRYFMERFLLFRGVRHGIYWDVLEEIIERVNRCEVVDEELVAEGIPPVMGQSARINLYFEKDGLLKLNAPSEEEEESDRVDHKTVHRINMVSKGQLIAEKVSLTKGKDGLNVKGEIIQSKGARDFPLAAGKNTVMNARHEIYAMIDGRPAIDDNGRVSVMPLYTVRGNLDLSVGNIEFNGNVEILGNVLSGFSVKAGGSIFVKGYVEAAVLEAEEDITIKGGYTGGDKGFIKAGRNCTLSHVNTGSIEVEGDLTVSRELVNCQTFVTGNLTFSSRKGSIIGGQTYVAKNLVAYNLGSHLGVNTNVYLGPYEICKRKLKRVQMDLRDTDDQLKIVVEGIEKFKENAANNLSSAQKEFIGQKLENSLKAIAKQKEELEREKSVLEMQLNQYHSVFVRVSGTAFPGLRLNIGLASWDLPVKITKAEFYENPDTRDVAHRPWDPDKKN